jgi:hypothetical protein
MLKWCLLLLVIVNLVLNIIVFTRVNKEKYQSEEDVTSSELEEATSEGESYEESPPNFAEERLAEFEKSGESETYQADPSLDDFYAKAQGVEGYDSEYEKAQEELKESFGYY